MYGVMIAVGILCCFLVLFFYTKIKKADEKFMDFVFFNGIAAIFIGFVFATLFQSTYNFIANPAAGFQIGSGMTFIGGLIGGVICFLAGYFIFRKKFETKLYQVVSMIPCAILIAHAWGRVGCFFAGCCYGKETDFFLGVTFPGMREDTMTLTAEIVEIHEKDSAPKGQSTKNWAGETVTQTDKGRRMRAILALGSQDVGDSSSLLPVDSGVEIVGCSSDHTIVDVTESGKVWRSGDTMTFRVRYANMLYAFTGDHVTIEYGHDA
jgi:hypothetical protein